MSIRRIGTTIFISIIFFIPINVYAGRGCCSSHGGVSGCSATGIQVCNDGTLSKTCTCTPPAVYGCTDSSASNYNSSANQNDGSCVYYVYGCTDPNAINYNSSANQDNGTCLYNILGCTDISAENYNPNANQDDGSCKYKIIEEDKSENITENTKKSNDYSNNKTDENSNEESDPVSTILGLGTIAGGAYLYKKRKNNN